MQGNHAQSKSADSSPLQIKDNELQQQQMVNCIKSSSDVDPLSIKMKTKQKNTSLFSGKILSFKPEHFIKEKMDYKHGYIKEESLGQGSFGQVHKVRSKFQHEEVRAIKQFPKEEIPPNQEHEYLCEIEVLKKFDHPNILKIYEFYQDSTTYYMITEYCQGGALDQLITQKNRNFKEQTSQTNHMPAIEESKTQLLKASSDKGSQPQSFPQQHSDVIDQQQQRIMDEAEQGKKKTLPLPRHESFLSEDLSPINASQQAMLCSQSSSSQQQCKEAACIMKQLFSAILYAHRRGIVHRDLKPQNIMIDFSDRDNYFIKVIDWGLAGRLKEGYLAQECGTVEYQAPEVISGDNQYNEKCDVWSCGIILYQLFSDDGTTPFEVLDKNEDKTKAMIFEGFKPELHFKSPAWARISQACKDFITAMLTTDFNARPAAEQCLQNHWFELFGHVAYVSKRSVQSHFMKMKKFNISFKLQQAVLAFICSQLINKQESQRLMRVFKHLDKNNDGILTREELIHCYKQCFSAANSSNNTAIATATPSLVHSSTALAMQTAFGQSDNKKQMNNDFKHIFDCSLARSQTQQDLDLIEQQIHSPQQIKSDSHLDAAIMFNRCQSQTIKEDLPQQQISNNNMNISMMLQLSQHSRSPSKEYGQNSPCYSRRKQSTTIQEKMQIIRKLSNSISNISECDEQMEQDPISPVMAEIKVTPNRAAEEPSQEFQVNNFNSGGGDGEHEHERTSEEIEHEVNQILNNVDLDKNGFIDYSEFICACAKIKIENQEKYLKQAFDVFDINKNGFITFQELKAVLGHNLSDIDENIWHEIIEEADLDGDKQISFDEFKNMMNLFAEQE